MTEVCVLTESDEKQRLFKFRKVQCRKTFISELDINVYLYAVPTRKRKFSKKTVNKITSNYENVYSLSDLFRGFIKKGSSDTLMTYVPRYALRKFTNINNINLQETQIGIVYECSNIKNLNILLKLCEKTKFITVYNCDENVREIVLEKTGLSVQVCSHEPTEDLVIILGKNLIFKYKGKSYNDINFSCSYFTSKYNGLPVTEILTDYLKSASSEKFFKKYQLKITGFQIT